MILSNKDIKKAIKNNKIIIQPPPDETQIDTTTIDLRIGKPIYSWVEDDPGIKTQIHIDNFVFNNYASKYLEEENVDSDGNYIIKPGTFYLAPTYEKIGLPISSKLAGRMEIKTYTLNSYNPG